MASTQKKPATEKKVNRKSTAAKTTARKASTPKAAGKQTTMQIIGYEQRYQMIAKAAYHIAETHDFMPQNELDDWLQAERQIDSWISSENIQLTN